MDTIMDQTNLLVSNRGFKVIKGGTTLTGSFQGFNVWTDTVISALYINGALANLADYGLDATTLPTGIPAGFPVYFPKDKIITSITITSGLLYMIRTPKINY